MHYNWTCSTGCMLALVLVHPTVEIKSEKHTTHSYRRMSEIKYPTAASYTKPIQWKNTNDVNFATHLKRCFTKFAHIEESSMWRVASTTTSAQAANLLLRHFLPDSAVSNSVLPIVATLRLILFAHKRFINVHTYTDLNTNVAQAEVVRLFVRSFVGWSDISLLNSSDRCSVDLFLFFACSL